jgi:hypothetical protein
MEICLTGDLAEKNIATSIADLTKLKTDILQIKTISPAFHQAYAAAAANIQNPDDTKSINVIPKDLVDWYAKQHFLSIYKKTNKYMFSLLTTSTVIAVASLLYLNSLKAQIPMQKSQIETNTDVNVVNVIKKANRIKTLFPQKTGPQEELNMALSRVPATISIESINFDATTKKFQLYGRAENRDDLLAFREALQNSEEFSKVKLPLGALTGTAEDTFSIEFVINQTK